MAKRRITLSVNWAARPLVHDEREMVRDSLVKALKTHSVTVEDAPPNEVRVTATVDQNRQEEALAVLFRALPGAFFRVGPPVLPSDIRTLAIDDV
jgi:hypothetical protein